MKKNKANEIFHFVCMENQPHYAMKLIKQIDIEEVNKDSCLFFLCEQPSMRKIALKLIEKGVCNFSNEMFERTALINSCENHMKEVAIKILETSIEKKLDCLHNQHNKKNESALLLACKNKMEKVAMLLLYYDDIIYDEISDEDETALNFACLNGMVNVALKIMDLYEKNKKLSNESSYDFRLFNTEGFLHVCENSRKYKFKKLALKMAKNGFIDVNGNALLACCKKGLDDIGLEILKNIKKIDYEKILIIVNKSKCSYVFKKIIKKIFEMNEANLGETNIKMNEKIINNEIKTHKTLLIIKIIKKNMKIYAQHDTIYDICKML